MKAIAISLLVFFTTCHLAGCKKKCSVLRDHPLSAFMYIQPNIERIKLGDTLRMKIMIPYKSYRLDTGEQIDVSSSSLSSSGLDFRTINKLNSQVVIEGNTFKIIPLKGSFKKFNDVNIRINYVKDTDGFVFEALVLATQKGLANFANYKAEGWMNGKCELNTFSPVVGSTNNHHNLYGNLWGVDIDAILYANQYYVWVE